MVGKQSHIRNPLTVIAIFAGIAELSGTAVLPALEPAVQYIYVWFLMGFPTALVVLFFLVLYLKHHVLYAPSDFRDDKGWLSLAEKRVILEQRVDRAIVEASEELSIEATEASALEATEPGSPEDTEAPSPSAGATPPNAASRYVDVRSRVRELFNHPIPITRTQSTDDVWVMRELAGAALEAETFFKEVIGRERGLSWTSELMREHSRFDGISRGPPMVVLETQYTRHSAFGPRANRMKKVLADVLSFYKTLSDGERTGFLFLYCVAYEEETFERMAEFRARLQHLATELPFKTEVVLEHMSELRRMATSPSP
ncbi:hypothetical protein [Sinorhizobium meliloti]|uniref:hypothetical protein n=1 Tax=Rhizobium meliloti TaxID=382 RepID=UPI000FDC4CFE|nr:hypothetical protein [Sinorhizobium meliloti]RVI80160.1 hypothetical protein CN191_12300 [Sinorhizobium meliloti]